MNQLLRTKTVCRPTSRQKKKWHAEKSNGTLDQHEAQQQAHGSGIHVDYLWNEA